MTRMRNLARFYAMAILSGSIILDQLTKAAARRSLPGTGEHHLVGDLLVMVYAENRGAFLGLGGSWPTATRQIVFIILSAAVLVATLGFTFLSRRLSRSSAVALAFIAGGGFGNMIDRVSRNGFVTDFLNVGIGRIRTGIFNIADLSITIGAAILAVSYFAGPRGGHSSPK